MSRSRTSTMRIRIIGKCSCMDLKTCSSVSWSNPKLSRYTVKVPTSEPGYRKSFMCVFVQPADHKSRGYSVGNASSETTALSVGHLKLSTQLKTERGGLFSFKES